MSTGTDAIIDADPSPELALDEAPAPSPNPGLEEGQLRIVLVAPPYFDVPPHAYGGVEAVVADLADALVERGHQVSLVGAGRPGTGARFLPVWQRTVPERLGEAFPEVAHAALSRRAVLDLARTEGVDVVHDHTFAGPLNAPAYAQAGIPTVVTVHGPVNGDQERYYRALDRDVSLVAISNRQRELAPWLNWIATVHNALDVRTWPYREAKEDYALFLGRFHPEKAPHVALDAAHAAGVPVILAGKCAEPLEKEYFAREVQPRLGPTDRVLGVADATVKRRLLAAARCLLFPVQWEEPFGMVMIEAMACGTPVVALRHGAVPEVVADGITGIICDHPDQLPRALRDVGALASAACRAHVAGSFSVEGLAIGYERAYRAAMSRHVRLGPEVDTLAALRAGYGDLEVALDRQYVRGTAAGSLNARGATPRGPNARGTTPPGHNVRGTGVPATVRPAVS